MSKPQKNLVDVIPKLAYQLFEKNPQGQIVLKWLWEGFVLPPLVSFEKVETNEASSDMVMFKAGQQDVVKRILAMIELHKETLKNEVKDDSK